MMERVGKDGAVLFAIAFLVASIGLSALIGSETIWSEGAALPVQPRFWPAVGLTAMVVFGAAHLSQVWRDGFGGSGAEAWMWLRGLEFAAWFLAYVHIVPQIGYLPASVFAAVALTMRAGFRGMRWVARSALLAAGIVVLFRALLRVHVPGGALYRALPDPLSNFMLTWL